VRNNRGLTFVEILVTAALIVVVIIAITNSLSLSQNFLTRIRGKRNRDRVVASTLQNVVENVSLFQKNFDTTPNWTNKLLDPAVLPIAWDQNNISTATACPKCPGRMGFIIQPVDNVPGINRLTIRVTHQTLIQGYQDYVFILRCWRNFCPWTSTAAAQRSAMSFDPQRPPIISIFLISTEILRSQLFRQIQAPGSWLWTRPKASRRWN
jgi:hypothetical protein